MKLSNLSAILIFLILTSATLGSCGDSGGSGSNKGAAPGDSPLGTNTRTIDQKYVALTDSVIDRFSTISAAYKEALSVEDSNLKRRQENLGKPATTNVFEGRAAGEGYMPRAQGTAPAARGRDMISLKCSFTQIGQKLLEPTKGFEISQKKTDFFRPLNPESGKEADVAAQGASF